MHKRGGCFFPKRDYITKSVKRNMNERFVICRHILYCIYIAINYIFTEEYCLFFKPCSMLIQPKSGVKEIKIYGLHMYIV